MKSDKTSIIGTIIAIVVLIVIIILSNLGLDSMNSSEKVLAKIFMPIQNGMTFLKNKITNKDELISDIEKLKEQNNNLISENSELKEKLIEYDVIKAENDTLKDFLNLTNKYTNYTTLACKVIEQSYSNYDKIIIIDSGAKDGLKVNMAVVGEEGLVRTYYFSYR